MPGICATSDRIDPLGDSVEAFDGHLEEICVREDPVATLAHGLDHEVGDRCRLHALRRSPARHGS